MNFFKKFYIPPTSGDEKETNLDDSPSFDRVYLGPSLFTDSGSAEDYVCKICHFMAVDPLEHVPGPDVTCSHIFCLPCVETYTASGLSSCPAEGCLTTGFDWSSLRELGTREMARLSNLTLTCEFNCSQTIAYKDYWTHREKCPANPENFCEICDSPKTGENHDCRETFLQLKEKDEGLVQENNQLKAEIDKLRRELDSLRGARAEKMANGYASSSTCATDNQLNVNLNNSSNEDKNTIRNKIGPNKGNVRNAFNYASNQINSGYSRDSKPSSINGDTEETGFLRGAIPQYKFHSNCSNNKSDHNRIRLIFHYGERSFKIDDAQPTFTFRTLRSLLHDMMKHDPGIMLLVRHRILHDRETIASCGFKPGLNAISMVPLDTPDFNEPGFRLALYRLKHATDPLDAKKVLPESIKPNDLPFISKESIDFYSNSLEPQIGKKDITLTFHRNGKDITLERVKRDQTISSIRSMVDIMTEGGCGKMMHITHQLIKDDMTVKQCGISYGTVDITLLPSSFPIDIEKIRIFQLLRFRNNGKLSKKFGKMKSRTNSMASLV